MPRFNILKSFSLSVNSRERRQGDGARDGTKPADYVATTPSSRNIVFHDSSQQENDRFLRDQYDGRYQLPEQFEGKEVWPSMGTVRNTFTEEDMESFRSWSPAPSVHREASEQGDVSRNTSGIYQQPVDRMRMINRVEVDYVNSDADLRSNPFQYGWPQPPRSSVLGERIKDKHTEVHNRGTIPSKDIGQASRQTADFPTRYLDDSRFNRHPLEDPHKQEPEVVEPRIWEHEIWNDYDDVPQLLHYIVPRGLDVIFKDENGNEITRVGEFSESINKPRHVSPTIIHDEYGNELYRTGDFQNLSRATSRVHSSEENRIHEGAHRTQTRPRMQRDSNASDAISMNRSGIRNSYSQYHREDRHISLQGSPDYVCVPNDAKDVILVNDQGHLIPLTPSSAPAPRTTKARR